MENPNQMKIAEQEILIPLNGFPGGDNVCISRSRYDELIRAEMEREILFHAYQIRGTYNIEPVMDAIFDPKFKYKPADNPNSKAGGENAE